MDAKEDQVTAIAQEAKPTLTVEETAELYGISRSLAYEAVKRGEIPSIRIGRRIVVPRARLMAMLETEKPAA